MYRIKYKGLLKKKLRLKSQPEAKVIQKFKLNFFFRNCFSRFIWLTLHLVTLNENKSAKVWNKILQFFLHFYGVSIFQNLSDSLSYRSKQSSSNSKTFSSQFVRHSSFKQVFNWNKLGILVQSNALPLSRPTSCWSGTVRGPRTRRFRWWWWSGPCCCRTRGPRS